MAATTTHLALEVNGCGADQIALIVRLLHRVRGCLSHHGVCVFVSETTRAMALLSSVYLGTSR